MKIELIVLICCTIFALIIALIFIKALKDALDAEYETEKIIIDAKNEIEKNKIELNYFKNNISKTYKLYCLRKK